MGVPTSGVGYTPAMLTREDHEFYKGHVVALDQKKISINTRCNYDICKEHVEDVSLKSTWTVLFNIKFDYGFQAAYNGHVGRNMFYKLTLIKIVNDELCLTAFSFSLYLFEIC